ncbi:MAG: acyloxyacyl hydrolase [Phycisphaerales bacterium]
MRQSPLISTAACCLAALPAFAENAPTITVNPAPFEYRAEPPAAEPASAPSSAAPFGAADTRWWSVGTGVAFDFEDGTSFNVHGSLSYFVAENIETVGEVGAWYYSQPGEDAFGINPAFVVRWHFINEGSWTVFADIGIGMLLASSDVPADNGTSINLTPRAGIGLTYALDDAGTRLQLGLRWAHVSNARITGHDDNFGVDAAMPYIGIVFPF